MFPSSPFAGSPPVPSAGVAPVNPSVINNFPSFSSTTGAMQDSGFSGASFSILAPSASTRNVIQPTGAAIIPFVVRGVAAQSANLFEWQNSTPAAVASINPAGLGTFAGGVTTAQTVIAGISDTIQLSVTPNGTQTNPTVKLFTSVAGKEFTYSKTGGIIHDPVDDQTGAGERIYLGTRTYTAYTGANLVAGVFGVNVTYTPSSSMASAQIAAIHGRISKTGSFDGGSATPSYLMGVFGDVTPVTNGNTFRYIGVAGSVKTSGTGTVTHAISMLADITGSMTSGLTNQYGVVIASTSTLGINSTYTSTPTNLYGMYVENITRGLTLNYSIFTNSGLVHFGDNAEIVGSKDAIQLSVTPNGTQTNPTVKFLTSTGGKDFQFSKTGGIVHNPVDDATGSGEYIYSASRTYTGTSVSLLLIGAMNDNVIYNPSGTAATAKIAGIGGTVQKTGNNSTGATGGYLSGLYGAAGVSGSVSAGTVFRIVGVIGTTGSANTGGGTTTHAMGILSSLGDGAGVSITNAYGIVIATTTTLGVADFAATPTNHYGLYVENVSSGATLNYAIFTNAGLVHFGDNVEMASGKNFALDTATGTKIGTATSQKLGFWNATPIIQPAGATQAAPAPYATGVFGLDSSANMQALYDLVVAMRTALVNSGIIKGAA